MTSMPIELAEDDTGCPAIPTEPDPCDGTLLRKFTDQGDAEAFEQLVLRHGPMVLGVCRRMLRDAHAADDAFQATFLVLVRKAISLRQPELLGNWLYGVAYRIAARARLQTVRRADHEQRFPTMPETNHTQDVERRELQEVLDEELNRLPREHRDLLVLCYLQGKTNVEAARVLGCPPGSISGRLAAARERLRTRLKRRGVVASAALFGTLLLTATARSAVPAPLLQATVNVAMSSAAGSLAVGTVSTHIAALAQSVLRGDARARFSQAMFGVLIALAAFLGVTMLAVWSVAEATLPPQTVSVSPATGSESPDESHVADGTSTLSPQATQEGEAINSAADSPNRRCGS